MMRDGRGAAVLVAAGVLAAASPAGALAAQGQGAQTTQRGTTTFIDTVPCASDQGFFEITLRFNSVDKFSEQGGHFTQTGRFTAEPVTPTHSDEHDGHEHPVVGEPRPGATYSGRFTIGGTFRQNKRVGVETFHFRAKGTSTSGDMINAHALFHSTVVNGAEKASISRERCN